MKKQIEPFHIHPSHIQYSISVFMFNRKGTYKKGIQKYNKWNGFLFCDFQINGAFSAWSEIEQIFALQYIIHQLQLKTWCVYNLEIMCLYCIRTFTGYSPINYRNQCITKAVLQWKGHCNLPTQRDNQLCTLDNRTFSNLQWLDFWFQLLHLLYTNLDLKLRNK